MTYYKVDPTFFPLGQIPFDAYCRVFDEYIYHCKIFTPTKMPKDLETGEFNRMLYWYPVYVDTLYDLAERGENYLEYLEAFNIYNSMIFITLFESTNKKLDKLSKSKIKTNVLSELKVQTPKN